MASVRCIPKPTAPSHCKSAKQSLAIDLDQCDEMRACDGVLQESLQVVRRSLFPSPSRINTTSILVSGSILRTAQWD